MSLRLVLAEAATEAELLEDYPHRDEQMPH
jgi:hypothetical protein